MLWNTAGEACWKWFTPLCDGNHVQIACCHKESIAYAVLFYFAETVHIIMENL